MKLSKYIVLFAILSMSLIACNKNTNTMEAKKGEIIDLKEQTQSVMSLEEVVVESNTSLPLEDSVPLSLDDLNLSESFNQSETMVVEESSSVSVRNTLKNLPIDNNIKGLDNEEKLNSKLYEFLGVTIEYPLDLIVDSWSEYPDSYISDDEKIYLMHNKEDKLITIDKIKEKFIYEHINENDIIVEDINGNTVVMANFIDETAVSNMAYVLLDNETHLFVLAKVDSYVNIVEDEMRAILDSAIYDSEIVDIYWTDKTVDTTFNIENIMGIDMAIGDTWELIPGISSSNIVYKVNENTNLSINYMGIEDETIKDETLNSYINVVKSSFGEPLELNTLIFNDSDVIWTEFVYKDTVVSGQKVDIAVYIGRLETGLLYLEMSAKADYELQYNDIKGMLDYFNK